MSLEDIYNDVSKSMEDQKPALIELPETHIDFETIIPASFYNAFYQRYGRSHIYHLESFVRSLVLQKLLGISTDALLLSILKLSAELREFCGFIKVPDSSQLTRFRANYCEHLKNMFEALVDLTDPICRKINAKKADYLVYDTTGIELPVAENNPKFFNTKLKKAKKLAKGNPDYDPYRGVYSLLPDASSTNPDARQQYINGHFCYALKMGVLTDGLGIPRHIEFFDEKFKNTHPEIVEKKTDSPDKGKEIGDSVSLKPFLSDFFAAIRSFLIRPFWEILLSIPTTTTLYSKMSSISREPASP